MLFTGKKKKKMSMPSSLVALVLTFSELLSLCCLFYHDNIPDPFAEENTKSGPSTWTLLSRLTEKRTASRMPQTSNNRRSGVTRVNSEYAGVEEGLNSDDTIDKHDHIETIVDGLNVKSSGWLTEDGTSPSSSISESTSKTSDIGKIGNSGPSLEFVSANACIILSNCIGPDRTFIY